MSYKRRFYIHLNDHGTLNHEFIDNRDALYWLSLLRKTFPWLSWEIVTLYD